MRVKIPWLQNLSLSDACDRNGGGQPMDRPLDTPGKSSLLTAGGSLDSGRCEKKNLGGSYEHHWSDESINIP